MYLNISIDNTSSSSRARLTHPQSPAHKRSTEVPDDVGPGAWTKKISPLAGVPCDRRLLRYEGLGCRKTRDLGTLGKEARDDLSARSRTTERLLEESGGAWASSANQASQ